MSSVEEDTRFCEPQCDDLIFRVKVLHAPKDMLNARVVLSADGTRLLAWDFRDAKVAEHPDRAAIEEAFLNWRSATDIVEEYGIAHHSAVYRHAHATGLFRRRGGQIRTALEFLIERANEVKPTGNVIINAVRAYCCLTEDGRWVEPAKKYIIEHVESPASPAPISTKPASSQPPLRARKAANSNSESAIRT